MAAVNPKLRDLIDRTSSSETFNWLAYRQELSDLAEEMDTESDRVALLKVYHAVMDRVEREPDAVTDWAAFRVARQQEYRLFLVQECLHNAQVDPEKLEYVTRREVEAGRLAPDDELRTLAIAGPGGIARPRPRKPGLLSRLFGR